MPDNVVVSQGQLTIATRQDNAGTQHQEVTTEFLDAGGQPLNVTTNQPIPTFSAIENDLLFSILVELRILNQQIYTLTNPECEPLELLRDMFRQMPTGSMPGASTIPGS